jgi:hypothetical protein
MKTRTDLLNHLVEKYNLQRYLEIGVQNTAQNFDKINCKYKVCVDPDPAAGATFKLTSDEFFYLSECKDDMITPNWRYQYDLVFIDGLHTAEQVKKDFENALKILSPNGFIVLHDCNPLKEEHTIVPRPTERGHWNGDVYKFACQTSLLGNDDRFTVDIDNGCQVITRGEDNEPIYWSIQEVMFPLNKYTWEFFDKNRKEILYLISWEEFINL